MSTDDRTPTVLTPASRTALNHYRAKAGLCRRHAETKRLVAVRPDTTDPATLLAEAEGLDIDAVRWDALADELEAFGETTGEHDDQGALL